VRSRQPPVRLPTRDVALTCLSRSRFLDRYKVTVGRVCNNVSEMLILVRTDVPLSNRVRTPSNNERTRRCS
jgi:hypothetical protein